MNLTKKEIKQRYFDRVYEEAPMIPCSCGCGQMIKSKDHYGRNREYVSGHNGRKYEDTAQYKREWNHRNRDSRYSYKASRIRKIKAELIRNAGGKCQLCGLPFDGDCTSLFDFHHLNPEDKLFNLNNASINKYNLEDINNEASKCELLCANCHRLIHWEFC
jgi:5-methylcytosine-specific restriction endonuclease McrA